MNLFDICIITASNSAQAEVYRQLLKRRVGSGLYPREIDFRVYSDPDGGRVGSGGGTLLALVSLLDDCGAKDPSSFFADHRILMIHAGGESRRLPCYAPEGKIFAPVPLPTSSTVPPVVLDLWLTLFLKYPWRRGELVVASGDVVIDFDPLSIPDDRGDVCGIAKPAPVEQGSGHGVFKFDRNRKRVVDFFQKAPPEFLKREALLEGTTECAIDTGIVAFSPQAATAVAGLADSATSSDATMGSELRSGSVKFDLYLETLTACLPHLSVDDFVSRVGPQSPLDPASLALIHNALHGFSLAGALARSATFLHFGSLPDFARSCLELYTKGMRPFYAQDHDELLPVCTPELVAYNCDEFDIPAGKRQTVVAESSEHCRLPQAMGRNVFVGISDLGIDTVVPEGICIDQRSIDGKTYRLVYSVLDSFRATQRIDDVRFCGIPMSQWLARHGLSSEDIWSEDAVFDLARARLFPADPSDQFLAGYWQTPFDPEEWARAFKAGERISIADANTLDSAVERDLRREMIRAGQLRSRLREGIGWRHISLNDFRNAVAQNAELLSTLEKTAHETDDELLRAYRQTLCSSASSSEDGAPPSAVSFVVDYLGEDGEQHGLSVAVKEDQIVWARCPVRLDLAGGWTDTPPFTLSFGGQVTNLGVDLNGQPPIQVFCRRTPEKHVRIHSIDLGISETATDFGSLSDYHNPLSPFGLPKAALCLLGLTAERNPGVTLAQCLESIGTGVDITLLCAVPKGSGLGTSSVLGGTILAALLRFFGKSVHPDQLFRQVLQMEQMLTTCGGWQDQIGGIVGGIKYIQTKPGLRPDPVIHQLDPFLFQDARSHSCFTLFYTGVTRLAKNILQEVVARVNTNSPAYLFTLDHVRSLARDARRAVGLRDLPMVARIIERSWTANKLIHPSTTNDEVEKVLDGCSGLYRGVKLLGAGGGGYALFVSETPDSAAKLRAVLRRSFENEKARIVDFSLNTSGLQVTVS